MRRIPIIFALLSTVVWSMASAQEFPSDGKFQALAKRYQTLLSRRPRKGTAFDMLYRHYLDAGQLDALVAHYEKQTKNRPDDVADHIVLALIHERGGRLEAALSLFERSAKLSPKDFYPEYASAVLMVRQYRPADAVKAFERALTKQPDRSQLLEIYKRLGRLHLRQGDQNKALKVWERLAKDFPDDRRVLEELAQLLSEEEQFDEAIQRFQQLIKLSGSDLYRQLMARVEIGQIQVRQGKLKTAITTFESCLEQVRPDSWMADDLRRRVEEVFLRGEDLAGLIEYYQKRLEKHPDDLAATIRLAATYSKLDRGKESIEQYRAALKRAPTRRDIRVKLIDELTRRDDLQGAVAESEALVKSQPDDVESIRQLGQLYLRAAGKNRAAAETKALATWNRIAERRPNDPLSAVQVAELCRRAAGIGSHVSGKSDDTSYKQASRTPLGKAALQYYEEAVNRSKGAPQYHEYLGEYLYSIGKTDEALTAWRKLAAPPNDSVDNLKRLAQVLSGTGQLDEATSTIEKAIAKDKDSYDLHDLAADLLVRRELYDEAIQQVDQLDRLADSPQLTEQALKRRITIYVTGDRLAAEAQKLAAKLESGNGKLKEFWLAAMMASSERRSTAALDYLAKALEKSPDDRTLLRFRAEVYQQGGDLAGAAQQFRQLAKLEPKSRSAHLRQVVQLELEMGRLEEARELAEEIVRMTPGNVESIQLLAEIEFRAGEDEKGLDAFRKAVQLNPRNTEVRLMLARKLAERQRIAEAIEHLWRAFELIEDLDGKLTIVGELAENHIITNRLPLLVERLKRTRSEQEDPFGQTLHLVAVYVRAEDFVNARRELAGLLSKRPDDVRVLEQLVALSDQLGDPDQALRYQEKVVELSTLPKHQERLAQLYADVGRDDEANAIWREIYKNTNDPKKLISAIDAAMRNSDLKQAILLADGQWTQHPEDWRFGQRLAVAYLLDKQPHRASEVATAILNLLPGQSYQEPKPKPTSRNSPRSYMSQYPPLLMRISMPMQLRGWLASSGSRNSGLGFQGWQVRELLDAQMMCTILLHWTAQAAKTDEAMVERLRERSKTDLMALRQLIWIHMSNMQRTNNTDKLQPLLKRWVTENPSDAEPRLLLFVGPLMRGDPSKIPNADEHLVTMKTQYDWFVNNRPKLGRFLAGPYAQLLMTFGKRDEAAKQLRTAVTQARSMMDLQMTSYLVTQMQDLELMSLMITRITEFRSKSPNSSLGVAEVQQLLQAYAQMAARTKKWDQVVESFDRFMTASHPKTIRLDRRIQSPSIGRRSFSSSRRKPSLTSFPAGSAWLDESRIEMLKSVHKMLQSAGQTQQLDELVAKRVKDTEGIPQQCWKLCRICLQWMDNKRPEAINQLAAFAEQVPGNVEVRMLLARAHAEADDNDKALAALDGLHLPFGRVAKNLEQLRMELAMRSDNEEVGKQAALRLFGMRLNTDEQTALAKVMRRFGLATRSEELIKMAVRTASNKPSELYKLMQQHQANDLKRAAEIARMIMRQVRRGAAKESYNSYRQGALGILKRVGDLDEMIEKAEKQLAAAPKSVTLMETLVEYYTANGDDDKVRKTVDGIVKIRPNDAKLHYKIAQSFFNQQKFADGVARLDVVWKKEPELLLQNSYQIGEYYAKAKKLDLLAKQLSTLKGNAILEQNTHYVTNIVQNLRHSTNDVDGVIKLYRVVIEIVPKRQQPDLVRNCGMMMVDKKRKADAYQFYKDYLFPKAKEKDASVPFATNGGYSVNGEQITIPRQLAKIAVQLKKSTELEKEINAATVKHPKWKPMGELLSVMMQRVAGDEQPITRLGKRFLADKEFAAALTPHYVTLREEFDSCKTEPALRTAIEIWKKPPQSTEHHYFSHDSTSDQIRVAAIHVKLKETKQARELLMKLTATPKQSSPSFGHDHEAEQEMRRLLSVANALREYKFHLDAVDIYNRALTRLPELEGDNWIRRNEVPTAGKAMRESVKELTGNRRDETLAAFKNALTGTKEDQLSRFFVVVDLPIVDQRYNSSSRKPNSAKEAQVLSKAESQLLPALLMHAGKSKKLAQLSKLVGQRIAGLDAKTKKQHGDRLAALQLMMSVTSPQPPVELAELKKWTERTKKNKDLAAQPATWLLAIAALQQETTRSLGVDLAAQVAASAIASGNAGRQQVAIAAITLHAGDRADALVQQLMAGRKGDPKTLFQFAQVHFQRKEYTKAVKVLEEVWRRDPEFIMPKIRQLMEYYVKAEQLDSLAKSLASVNDQNLINRYPFEVPNSFRNLPKNLKLATQVVDLYLVSIEMAPAHSSYIASQMNQYLQGLPQNERTLDVYLKMALPSKQNPGEISNFANKIVELATKTKRVDAIRKQCETSSKEHPEWHARGQLLIGMLDAQGGNQSTLIEVAKKYKTDSKFASSLSDATSLLRTELAKTDERPGLELALELWRDYAANESADGTYGTQQVASLLVKLGDREAARQTLLAALNRPFSINYNTDEEYIEQMKLQRLRGLAAEFQKHDFKRDAVMAYARTSTIDAGKLSNQSYSLRQLRESRDAGRKLIGEILKSNADQTLTDLETILKDIAKQPDKTNRVELTSALDTFFTVFDASNTGEKPAAPDSLMTELLQLAKKNNRLEGLHRLSRQARKQNLELTSLIALDVLCKLATGKPADVGKDFVELSNRAKKSPGDAVWLVAREAMKNPDTREHGHTLAEIVAQHAASKRNRSRQEAVVLALTTSLSAIGKTKEANAIMRKLIGGDDSPQSQLQMARILFGQKQGSQAAKLLVSVWKTEPELLLAQFQQLTPLYVEAGEIDQLVAGLISIDDKNARLRFDSSIVNWAGEFARSSKKVDEATKLLKATVKFSELGNHSYAISTLVSHLNRTKQKAEAWDVYREAVLPPTGPTDKLPNFASAWIGLSIELKKTQELEAGAAKTVKAHPKWTSCYDLLTAMTRLRQKKGEAGFVELVKKYQADASYAKNLESSKSILRTELAKCDSKEVLPLAIELWEEAIDQLRTSTSSSSTNYQQYDKLAQLLLKAGRRDDARKLLLEAVDAPAPRYGSSYMPYYHFRRSEFLGPKFQAAGFHLDAVQLMQRHQSLVGTKTATERRLGSRLAKQRSLIRTSIQGILSEQLDESVQHLETALKESPPNLDTFFAPVSQAWNLQQVAKIPKHARGTAPHATQLLPATLRHARQHKQFEPIKQALAAARKKYPKHNQLAALEIFVNQFDSDSKETLPMLIQLSRNGDRNVRALSLSSLGQLKQPAATAAIVAAATDRDTKLMAIDMLRRQNTPDAAKALGKWYAATDPVIRMRVFAALRRMRALAARDILKLEQVAFDGFQGKAQSKWKVQNADATSVWFDKQPGMLTIKAKNAGIGTKGPKVANIYLMENPAAGRDFQVTVCVASFTPNEPYQQAALLCWNDDKNYVKFSFEGSQDGKSHVVQFAVRKGRRSRAVTRVMPPSTNRLWLRITKFGDRYQCATSTDGKSFSTLGSTYGPLTWSGGDPKFIGFAALSPGSPKPKEIDVSFDSFDVRQLGVTTGTANAASRGSR